MAAGYIYQRLKKPPKVPFIVNILLWVVSCTILFSLVFGVWKGELGATATSFYVSLGHTGKTFK